MDIDTINYWVENPARAESEEMEDRFFDPIGNRIPEQITYDQLRQINISEDPPATLDDLVEELGIEILAYYIPFHFHRPDRPWGIYLRRVGIAHVRHRLVQIAGRDGYNFQNTLEIPTNVAKDILLLHELRHHGIEVAFARLELLGLGYDDAYQRYIGTKRNNRVLHASTEAICNANVANQRKPFKTNYQPPRVPPPLPNLRYILDWRGYVRQFMRGQPDGYHDFAQFTGFDSEQVLHSLRFPVERQELHWDLPQIKNELNKHSSLSILSSLPVPIRVV